MGEIGDKLTPSDDAWRDLLRDDPETISDILAQARRIAVIGIKTAEASGPAFTTPAYLQRHGFDVVPVPVYFPDATEILGVPVHRTLATIDPPADVVQMFRRSEAIAEHVPDILAAEPSVVWMQLGIRDDAVAETLARAGIRVVQDKCMRVEFANRHPRAITPHDEQRPA